MPSISIQYVNLGDEAWGRADRAQHNAFMLRSRAQPGNETEPWRRHCTTVQRAPPSRAQTSSCQQHVTWWTRETRTATLPSTWRSSRETGPSSSSYCLKMQTWTALTTRGILWSIGQLVSLSYRGSNIWSDWCYIKVGQCLDEMIDYQVIKKLELIIND